MSQLNPPYQKGASEGCGALIRQAAVGSQVVDHIRKMLAELREEVMRPHAGLRCHALHLIITECAVQLLRRDRLIGAVAYPGLRDVAQTRLLESSQEATKAATHPSTHRTLLATAKHAHQYTLQRGGTASASTHEAAENLIQESHSNTPSNMKMRYLKFRIPAEEIAGPSRRMMGQIFGLRGVVERAVVLSP
jgi:hypothetical protein